MKSKALTELLNGLREAREDLVSRTIGVNPQLFSCFFESERNETLLFLQILKRNTHKIS